MSVRLAAISLFLRLYEKPKLARTRDPRVARENFERVAARLFRMPPEANVIEDRTETPAGPMPVDWISHGRPDRHAVVIYLHGGAYIMGSRATHRHLAAHLARHAGARIALPEYRLAPEHPFPAALDDALALYRSLLGAGYTADRIAICGDSAGGGLAFATLLAARAEGLPDPACIVGFSPWLDHTLTQPSLKRNARKDPMLPASRIHEVSGFYTAGADVADPRISPLFGDFTDPPPALIQASRIELLADEAEAMAMRLRDMGGEVRMEWRRRAPHAWQIFAGMAPEADEAVRRAGLYLSGKLKTGDAET